MTPYCYTLKKTLYDLTFLVCHLLSVVSESPYKARQNYNMVSTTECLIQRTMGI